MFVAYAAFNFGNFFFLNLYLSFCGMKEDSDSKFHYLLYFSSCNLWAVLASPFPYS